MKSVTAPVPRKFANPLDDPLRPQNPLVARQWIVMASALMLGAAALAVYAAVALLFWQGQWQLIFHPSNDVERTPASSRVHYEEVRFDATRTGRPRLAGWWVPADDTAAAGPHGAVLYLHEARGSLSDALPDILALHNLGVDVFAFDPRGFGKSTWAKPSERHWDEDSTAALAYLVSVRHLSLSNIVPVGRGLGATVAATLTLETPEIHSMVMVDPHPPTLALLEAPRWTAMLPVRLLARDHFDPGTALHVSPARKLFLLPADAPMPPYIKGALPPATAVPSIEFSDPQSSAALRQLLRRTLQASE